MAERRRGAELEAALLEAAWDEMVEVGYGALTLEGVASRAGTSRPVIARRWADKAELVRAALARQAAKNRPATPDTGSLRGDLLALLGEFNATRLKVAATVAVQLAAYLEQTDTTPAQLREFVTGDEPDIIDVLLGRGIARGEVDPARLTDRIRSVPFVMLRHELVMTREPVAPEVLEEIVDTIFLPLVRPLR